MLFVTGLYMGRYKLRTGSGRTYIHIPVKLAGEINNRKVKVVAVINTLGCDDRRLHGSLISFTATLVEVGGTYRLHIPSRYASALKEVIGCVELDLWITPLAGARRGKA
jgi:hypothetical protein